jgi:putative copper export protein
VDNEQRWRARDRWWRRLSQLNLAVLVLILAVMAWTGGCP